MMKFTHKLLFILIIGIPTIFITTSCNNDKLDPPTVLGITANPDTVDIGEVSQIIAEVKNIDQYTDDDIVFYYSSSGGSIEGKNDSAYWQSPNIPGRYVIKVLVSDYDGSSDSDTVGIVVRKPDSTYTLSGYASFTTDTIYNLKDSKAYLYSSHNDFITHNPTYITNCFGFGPSVSYSFPIVSVGKYYLAILKDNDNNNLITYGDYYGWYGTGSLTALDPPKPLLIEIKDKNLSNYNVKMLNK